MSQYQPSYAPEQSSPELSQPMPNEQVAKQHNSIQDTLSGIFGYREFRPQQLEVIEAILQGKDMLVLMPTGGGKSICYQLPSLLLPGITIVVSPLLSLMQDQLAALSTNGISAETLNSTQTPEEQREAFSRIQNGQSRLLYLSPEKLMQQELVSALQTLQVSLIAIDEAHCVSHWGHDFRPEYCQLGRLKQWFPQVPMMALTATADVTTQQDIVHQLAIPNAEIFKRGFDRPNIRYILSAKYKPVQQLINYIEQQDGSGIVYCNSRKKVEDLTSKLKQSGINAAGYHAGMDNEHRASVQQQFSQDNVEVIVATVAFGMGINKSNVRFVVHFDLPRSVESYYQETGRAGRDGMNAEALLLFDEKEIKRNQEWIAMNPNAERREVELNKFQAMVAFAEAQTCRRQVLLNYFSELTEKTCGNCDVCLDPPKRFDATVEAQKILSAVYRVQQKEPLNSIVNILVGKQTASMPQHYVTLSVFGVGKQKPEAYWSNLIYQLIHQGYLRQESSKAQALFLCSPAKAVLKSECVLTLAVPRLKTSWKKSTKDWSGADEALFAKLKHLRKVLAQEEDVPPFVVFSDATLAEMATDMPTTSQAMLRINGVGQTKLSRYGEQFIAKIAKHLQVGQ